MSVLSSQAKPGEKVVPSGGPGRRGFSRRQLLEAFVAVSLAGTVASLSPAAPRRRGREDVSALLPQLNGMRSALQQAIRPWALAVEQNAIARPPDDKAKPADRHTYTVDVAQLMTYYAVAGDLPPYLALREFAVKNLIVNDPKLEFTQGFVLWRHNPGLPPDASGTTEALRLVRALWEGAKAFDRADDAALARMVLDGYARHQIFDKGIWMICNYYNFGTKSFATNSFIIDYDPDLVREIADSLAGKDEKRRAAYSELADRSYNVLRRSVAPCGLLYDVLQPELKTMYFDVDVSYFSPNDIIQLNNACTTASTVAKGDPSVGMGVLAFVLPRVDWIKIQYYGRTGEPAPSQRISGPEYGALARLAALLSHRPATAIFTEKGMAYWERIVSSPNPRDVWQSSEVLLAMQAVLAMPAS